MAAGPSSGFFSSGFSTDGAAGGGGARLPPAADGAAPSKIMPIFVVDASGSTKNVIEYWARVRAELQAFRAWCDAHTVKHPLYFIFGASCRQVSLEQLLEIIDTKGARVGSEISCDTWINTVASTIPRGVTNLWIVTDGICNDYAAALYTMRSRKIYDSLKFSRVVLCCTSTEGVNMSVPLPFLLAPEHQVLCYTPDPKLNALNTYDVGDEFGKIIRDLGDMKPDDLVVAAGTFTLKGIPAHNLVAYLQNKVNILNLGSTEGLKAILASEIIKIKSVLQRLVRELHTRKFANEIGQLMAAIDGPDRKDTIDDMIVYLDALVNHPGSDIPEVTLVMNDLERLKDNLQKGVSSLALQAARDTRAPVAKGGAPAAKGATPEPPKVDHPEEDDDNDAAAHGGGPAVPGAATTDAAAHGGGPAVPVADCMVPVHRADNHDANQLREDASKLGGGVNPLGIPQLGQLTVMSMGASGASPLNINLAASAEAVKTTNLTLAQMFGVQPGRLSGNFLYYFWAWMEACRTNGLLTEPQLEQAMRHLIFRLRNTRLRLGMCKDSTQMQLMVPGLVAVWSAAHLALLPLSCNPALSHVWYMQAIMLVLNTIGAPIHPDLDLMVRLVRVTSKFDRLIKHATGVEGRLLSSLLQHATRGLGAYLLPADMSGRNVPTTGDRGMIPVLRREDDDPTPAMAEVYFTRNLPEAIDLANDLGITVSDLIRVIYRTGFSCDGKLGEVQFRRPAWIRGEAAKPSTIGTPDEIQAHLDQFVRDGLPGHPRAAPDSDAVDIYNYYNNPEYRRCTMPSPTITVDGRRVLNPEFNSRWSERTVTVDPRTMRPIHGWIPRGDAGKRVFTWREASGLPVRSDTRRRWASWHRAFMVLVTETNRVPTLNEYILACWTKAQNSLSVATGRSDDVAVMPVGFVEMTTRVYHGFGPDPDTNVLMAGTPYETDVPTAIQRYTDSIRPDSRPVYSMDPAPFPVPPPRAAAPAAAEQE